MGKWLASACVLAMGTGLAVAQEGKAKPWWGFDVGVYRPNSSEIRDRFGDTLYKFGLRPFEDRLTKDWKFAIDVSVLSARRDGEHLLAIPLTFGFTKSFGRPEDSAIPYVQIAAGPAYYNYSITRELEPVAQGDKVGPSERIKKSTFGGNVNVEVGVMFNRRFSASLRGDWYTKTEDFDFSGVSLTLSYAAFRW